MPVFQVELSDGRAFEIEADAAPSEADVLKALGAGGGTKPEKIGDAVESVPTAQLRAAAPVPVYQRAYRAVRETLSPLLGPTQEQMARDSVEWGGQRLYKPLGSEVDRSGFFPALSKPSVELPKFDTSQSEGLLPSAGKAVANTAMGFVDFATSPLGFATMAVGGPIAGTAGKAGKAIHRGVAGAFGADMLVKSPEAIVQAIDTARDPNATLGQKFEAGVGAGVNLALGGYLGAKGAGFPRARVNAEARGIERELGETPGNTGGTPAPLQLPERTGPIITPPPQPTFDKLRTTLGTVEEQLREAALLRDEGDFTTEARSARSPEGQRISDETATTPATAELRTGGETDATTQEGQTLLDQITTETRSAQSPEGTQRRETTAASAPNTTPAEAAADAQMNSALQWAEQNRLAEEAARKRADKYGETPMVLALRDTSGKTWFGMPGEIHAQVAVRAGLQPGEVYDRGHVRLTDEKYFPHGGSEGADLRQWQESETRRKAAPAPPFPAPPADALGQPGSMPGVAGAGSTSSSVGLRDSVVDQLPPPTQSEVSVAGEAAARRAELLANPEAGLGQTMPAFGVTPMDQFRAGSTTEARRARSQEGTQAQEPKAADPGDNWREELAAAIGQVRREILDRLQPGDQQPLLEVPKVARPLEAERIVLRRLIDQEDARTGEPGELGFNAEREKRLTQRLADVEAQLLQRSLGRETVRQASAPDVVRPAAPAIKLTPDERLIADRSTPREGTPERDALEAKWKAAWDAADAAYRASDKITQEYSAAKYGTKKKESLALKAERAAAEYQKLKPMADAARKEYHQAGIEDLAEAGIPIASEWAAKEAEAERRLKQPDNPSARKSNRERSYEQRKLAHEVVTQQIEQAYRERGLTEAEARDEAMQHVSSLTSWPLAEGAKIIERLDNTAKRVILDRQRAELLKEFKAIESRVQGTQQDRFRARIESKWGTIEEAQTALNEYRAWVDQNHRVLDEQAAMNAKAEIETAKQNTAELKAEPALKASLRDYMGNVVEPGRLAADGAIMVDTKAMKPADAKKLAEQPMRMQGGQPRTPVKQAVAEERVWKSAVGEAKVALRRVGYRKLGDKLEAAYYVDGQGNYWAVDSGYEGLVRRWFGENLKVKVGEDKGGNPSPLVFFKDKKPVAVVSPRTRGAKEAISAKDIIAKLEAMKQAAGGETMATVIPGLDPATFRAMRNTALDVAIGAIKAGRAIREAAEAGWQNLKAALDKLGLKYDAAQLRAEFVQALTESDARVGLSARGTGILGDESLSAEMRSGVNPAYARRPQEEDAAFARRIVQSIGGPEAAAREWLAGNFRTEPEAVQTLLGIETQRQLANTERAARSRGDVAAADGIVTLQQALAEADMQRATDLGQGVAAFRMHYANWTPAAWVKDFREKVAGLAAERVDRARVEGRGSSVEGKTEATPTGIAQGVAEGVADKIEAEGNPKLAKTIREHWGKRPVGDTVERVPTTLEERLAKVGTKNPKATARKVQGFYEKEVRDWRRKHKIPEFDAETEREIIREANRIEQLPEDSIQRREAAIQLHDRIARMKGFEWWELPLDFWYANILSGFTTHARNILGNSVNLGAESAVMMARNPTAIPQILEALGRALPKSAREAGNVLRTGRDTAGREHASKFDAPGVLERVANPVASKLLLPWKLVGRTLRAEDLAAFYPLQEARAAVLARHAAAKDGVPIWKRSQVARKILGWTADAQARAVAKARGEGLAPGTLLFKRRVSELLENQRPEVLMRNAREFAFDGTFNNDPYGLIGAVADGIKNASVREPALKFVVPFTRIVANVSNSMLNWTPVGFWRAGRAKGYKLLLGKESNTGKLFGREVTDPQAIGDEFTRATVGTAALLGVAAAAAASIYDRDPKFAVTGGGPSDPDQKALLRQTGWIPYSVKVGDRYVSYQNTMAGLGLGIIGAYMDAVRYRNLDEQDALNRAAFALGSGFNVVLNSSFLSGLASLFNQASETGTKHPVKGVPATAIRTATSLAVPNFVKQVDQLFDPTRYSSDDVRGMMLGQIPFARRNGQPDLNVFGEPVLSPLSKTFWSQAQGDLLTRTLAGRRLWPSVPAESGLTADEHYEVMRLRGPLLRAALAERLGEITSLPRADAQAVVSQVSAEQTRAAMQALGLDNVAKVRREVQRGARK